MENKMVKKILTTSIILAAAAVASQCSAGYAPPMGSLFTDISMNKDVSSKTAVGGKTGKACVTGILGLIATGDASVEAAAKAGKINTVNAVDYKRTDILGSVYSTVCTVAQGD
jgi:hypothetical protein